MLLDNVLILIFIHNIFNHLDTDNINSVESIIIKIFDSTQGHRKT